MLRFKFFFIVVLFSSLFAIEQNRSVQKDINSTFFTKKLKYIQTVFKNGVRDLFIGSYYDALNEFSYVIKYPQTKYYLPSLYYLAKIYLSIGKRVGDKKYLWTALNYLNLYLSKRGKKDANYYYLKANIFENLHFYERAFANYEIALQKAKSKKEKLKVLIGLLRTSVWLKKLDRATKYIVILSIEELSKEQKREFEFLEGMYYFVQEKYEQAFNYLKRSYRYYENFLIDNPYYYYYVAETAYRVKAYKFSEMLFKRILFYIKNREVLQKTLLRLGDINFVKRNFKTSADYYIRLIKRFPQSESAIIAKLKLLYLIDNDKRLKFYVEKYFPDNPFVKEPEKFVVQMLVKYRPGYIGLFALANYGYLTLKLDSDKLYKRFEWELSLVSTSRLEFEQKEYIRQLWEKFLLDEKRDKRVCSLYLSNPKLFLETFDKKVLLKIASYLKNCKKMKARIDLLNKLYKKMKDPTIGMELARAYLEQKEYKKAFDLIVSLHLKSCSYFKLYSQICFLGDFKCDHTYREMIQMCGDRELYSHIFDTYLNLKKGKLKTTFLLQDSKILAKAYKNDLVVRKFVERLSKKLIEQEKYQEIIKLLAPIAKEIANDCFLNTILSLSYVRVGKIVYAKEVLARSKDCNNSWYSLAKIAIKNDELEQIMK